MNYGIGVLAGALIIEPTVKALASWESQWCAYRHTGEYNLDGNKGTDDWAEQRDTASSKWGMIRITEYKKPWFPGGGRVIFYTKDENGEHRNEWRLTKWWENRENRRQVSESQAASIEDNGNGWPTTEDVLSDSQVEFLLAEATSGIEKKLLKSLLLVSDEVKAIRADVASGANVTALVKTQTAIMTKALNPAPPCPTDSERTGSPTPTQAVNPDLAKAIDALLDTINVITAQHKALGARFDALLVDYRRRQGVITRAAKETAKEVVEKAISERFPEKCSCEKVPLTDGAKKAGDAVPLKKVPKNKTKK